jgi:hypothetical protein
MGSGCFRLSVQQALRSLTLQILDRLFFSSTNPRSVAKAFRDDTNVILLVSNPGFSKKTITSTVETLQVAPPRSSKPWDSTRMRWMLSKPKAPRSCRVCPSPTSSHPGNQLLTGALWSARFFIAASPAPRGMMWQLVPTG